MLTIIHEINHYLRRVNYPLENINECETPRECLSDGGELMYLSIFGKRYFSTINDNLADILLNEKNWDLPTEELNKAIGQLPQKAKCTIQTMTINKDEDDSNKSWDCISMAERLKSKLPKV